MPTADPVLRDTRSAILDAAERLVVERGVSELTIEAVAKEAGLSKGGVFYHFASKADLTVAMIDRFVAQFDGAMEGLAAEDGDPRGRKIRAYLRATAGETSATGPQFDRACGSITAALANFPEKLEPVRAQGARHQAEIETDGLDPVFATIIRLAIDGLWLSENLNLGRQSDAMKKAVTERLIGWSRLVELPLAEAAGAPAAPPPRRAGQPRLRIIEN